MLTTTHQGSEQVVTSAGNSSLYRNAVASLACLLSGISGLTYSDFDSLKSLEATITMLRPWGLAKIHGHFSRSLSYRNHLVRGNMIRLAIWLGLELLNPHTSAIFVRTDGEDWGSFRRVVITQIPNSIEQAVVFQSTDQPPIGRQLIGNLNHQPTDRSSVVLYDLLTNTLYIR